MTPEASFRRGLFSVRRLRCLQLKPLLLLIASAALGLPPAVSASCVPIPRDTPYAGVIKLDVDATDLDRKMLHIRETIPVRPARLVLLPRVGAHRGPP